MTHCDVAGALDVVCGDIQPEGKVMQGKVRTQCVTAVDVGVWQRLPAGVDALSSQDHPHVREATPLLHVWKGVQPIFDAQHSQTHPPGHQAFRL